MSSLGLRSLAILSLSRLLDPALFVSCRWTHSNSLGRTPRRRVPIRRFIRLGGFRKHQFLCYSEVYVNYSIPCYCIQIRHSPPNSSHSRTISTTLFDFIKNRKCWPCPNKYFCSWSLMECERVQQFSICTLLFGSF